jgi:hypothetical protein
LPEGAAMRICLAVLFAIVVLASPRPQMAATGPSGFSAHVALSIQATGPKGQLALRGAAVCERRGGLVRFDLLTLALDGGNGGVSVPSLTPSGGYAVVYDTASMVYTVWSPSRRVYYTGKGKPPIANPAATPTPEPSPSPGSNVSSFLAKLKDLRQFSVSLSLAADKTPIGGHPTTNFDFKLVRQVTGGDPTNVTGRASFADDLGGIPLLFVLAASDGPGGAQTANLRAALSDVNQNTPPEPDFKPPAGFKKVDSLLDVITIPGLQPGTN